MTMYHFDSKTIINDNVWIDHLITRIGDIQKDIKKYKDTMEIAKRPHYWQYKIDEAKEILNLNKEYFKRITGIDYEDYFNQNCLEPN